MTKFETIILICTVVMTVCAISALVISLVVKQKLNVKTQWVGNRIDSLRVRVEEIEVDTDISHRSIFISPKENERVGHKASAIVKLPTIANIEDLWFVHIPPEGGYHPQLGPVPYTGSHEYAIPGRVGPAGEEFLNIRFKILIVGVTDDGTKAFRAYLSSARAMGWPGMDELPPDSKVLGSVKVIR